MFFSSLTAREHLVFHAINRLGGKYTKDQCLKRVDEVIKEVELVRCADTIIGGGEFALVKGTWVVLACLLRSIDNRRVRPLNRINRFGS